MISLLRDPGLQRVLDQIEQALADQPPEHQAEVWVTWCEGSHVVIMDQPTDIRFGEWCGPRMAVRDIVIHARNLQTGAEITKRGAFRALRGPSYLDPGCMVRFTNLVIRSSDWA